LFFSPYSERRERVKRKKKGAQLVMEGLEQLAFGEINDAVRLAFSEEMPSPELLAGMNLFNVSEIKCAKGGVEIKFFDRIRALEKLYEIAHAGDSGAAAASLLEALAGVDDDAV